MPTSASRPATGRVSSSRPVFLLRRLRVGGKHHEEATGAGSIRAGARQRSASQKFGGRAIRECGVKGRRPERVAEATERLVTADEHDALDRGAAGLVVQQDEEI